LRTAADAFFVTTFPCNCRFCTAPLTALARVPVCDDCLQAIQHLQEPVCSVCGERLLNPQPDETRCAECLREEKPYRRAVAYGSYDGALRNLIHLLKYDQVLPVAAVLGGMLADAVARLTADLKDKPLLVVPVPLHRVKLRQRGFNQAELIARAMLKHQPRGRMALSCRVLHRRRNTGSQIGLSRDQRLHNLRGAFAAEKTELISGREVLLVDDVLTTGTTVSECARVLQRAGATRIWVATVARVLRTGSNPMLSAELEKEFVATGVATPAAQA